MLKHANVLHIHKFYREMQDKVVLTQTLACEKQCVGKGIVIGLDGLLIYLTLCLTVKVKLILKFPVSELEP